jgi:hypothetical protein
MRGVLTWHPTSPGSDRSVIDMDNRAEIREFGDVGYWNGIVRVGRFDSTIELIEQQDHDFRVTIERTDQDG